MTTGYLAHADGRRPVRNASAGAAARVADAGRARPAELGRSLIDDETEAALREIGHPLMVAARSREGPRHVVGPALYPYWMFAVKVAVTIQIALAVIVFFAQSLSGGDMARAFDHAVSLVLTGSAILVGIATAIAWVIERRDIRIRYLDRWRVRDPRGLEILSWDWGDWSAARETPTRRRPKPSAILGRAVGAIAFGAVLVLWWIGVVNVPLAVNGGELRDAGIETGNLAIDWSAVKAALFWPVLIYGLAIIGPGAVILTKPRASARSLPPWRAVRSGAALPMVGVVAAAVCALGRMIRGVLGDGEWAGRLTSRA